jgi:hypothetical protein
MGRGLAALLVAAATLSADPVTIRGELTASEGGKPAIETADGKSILLEGDADTAGVIRDARLHSADVELTGEFIQPGQFRIGPIHKKSMWVWKEGEKHSISYWCEVCAIRTYTPGICMCCQEETELQLRRPEALPQ